MPTFQWVVNRVPVSGATSSTFALQIYTNDTVFCLVGGNPPCPATFVVPGVSNAIVINSGSYLGVSSITQGMGDISLYPNPNTGSFLLSGTINAGSGSAVTYEVSNMLGQVVYRGTTTPQNGRINERITLGNAAAGSYLLRVNTDAGSQTFHFVISK